MCSCYSVSLQGKTYISFYYLSRLNNSPTYKLEKGKPITLAEKYSSAVHLPLNRMPTCAEAEDQHQQLGGRSKHFLHLLPIHYVNLVKNKHRGSLSTMLDL